NLPGEGDTADIFRRRRRECYPSKEQSSRIAFFPAPHCENKAIVSPSPASNATSPGTKDS
ncbi:MAG: hypothetical protein ACLT1D_15895, partial [[Clostridium] symbiosum]